MGLLINGQVGWRAATVIAPSTPSLWSNIYAVYNAENNANDALNTYNGTAQGGLTYGVGKVGTAFQFNGTNSYVQLGDVMDVGTSSWSYSMWFNASQLTAGNYYTLFSKSIAAVGIGRVYANIYNNNIQFGLDPSSNGSTIIAQSVNTININNWYHLVCVLDRNDKLKIYLNGSLISTNSVGIASNNLTPFISTNFNNNNPFRIGTYTAADNTTPISPFNGSIDAFNVWNRVLTSSEITELYNSGNGKQYPN